MRGAEIAKNTILANVMAVTLHDSQTVTPADCGSNFYLSPADAHAASVAMSCREPFSARRRAT